MSHAAQASENKTHFALECGCVMDIGRGGYRNICALHKNMPTFEDFKRALRQHPRTPESLQIINMFNARRSEEIREAHGTSRVEAWVDLPQVGNVLLTTIGAKTGKGRTVPLGAIRYGDKLIVEASVCGSPTHPAWYYNILANPEVVVETCGVRYRATARIADGEERTEIWRHYAALRPIQDELQAMVQRVIPVVVLSRSGPPLDASADKSVSSAE